MATSSLYGSVSESTGLYGIGAASGGTYFEWFIFYDSATAPATPTGGSWSFTTNNGIAPTGWLSAPPAAPVNQVWVSIAIVDSRSTSSLVWSTPGLMTGSGLPILTGSGVPSSGTGLNGQLYINTATTPQSMYNKQSGAWVQLTGASLYATSGVNSNITGLTGLNAGGIATPTFIQMSTAGDGAKTAGKLQWDPTYGGPTIGMSGGNVNQNIGQDGFVYVYNNTGSTINKGQVVYISGSQGQKLTVALAQANDDATSISVLGFAAEAITNNNSGFVATFGLVENINTNGFADGASIWLSPTTPGGFTTTKPVAPNHLVLLGYVVKGNSVGGGSVYVFTQNGYELDELHDVRITSLANRNLLQYDSSVPAWVNIPGPNGSIVGTTDTQTLTNKTISGANNTLSNIPNSALVNDRVTVNGIPLILGANQTIAASWLLPSYAGNAGKVLAVNPSASDVQWITAGGVGTVTSVDLSTGSTGLTATGGPITAAGTITLGGTLNVANGGTGVTTSTGTGSVVLSNSPTLVTPNLGTPTAGNFSTGTFTWPTFNQNTTGNAATATTATNVSGGSASVTTLTTSSVVTLNGGTINQVQYLDGSKVLTGSANMTFNGTRLTVADFADASLTSGRVTYAGAGGNLTDSANLTFDGTNLGVGNALGATFESANDAGRLVIGNGSGNEGLTVFSGSTGLGIIDFADASSGVATYAGFLQYSHSADAMLFGTGSAERMRLTSTGLGIGTSSPAAALHVASGNFLLTNGAGFSAANSLIREINIASGAANQFVTSAIGFRTGNFSDAGVITFSTANNASTPTERMRLDQVGNLGIGTSSPAQRLQVSGTSAATYALVTNAGTGPSNLFLGAGNAVTQIIARDGSTGAVPISIIQGASETMRLDSSGNLGLGVTPSAWGSGWRALQVGQAASLVSDAVSTTRIYNNAYFDGTNLRYINTSSASQYRQTGAQHDWWIAPSGTAGAAISFTQAMTLDASGNLGIGTSSPATRLHVNGGDGNQIRYQGATNIVAMGMTGANPFIGSLTNAPLLFLTNAAETMRLDSAGNLGLGVTPAAWNSLFRAFQFGAIASVAYDNSFGATVVANNAYGTGSGAYAYINATSLQAARYEQQLGQHRWFTAPSGTAGATISFTQAMTLSASGNLSIGTTATDIAKIYTVTTAAGLDNYRMADENSSVASGIRAVGDAIAFRTVNAERARIDASGNLGIGTTTIGGSANDRQVTVSGSSSAQASFTSNGVVTNSAGANTTLGYIGTTTNHPFIFTTNNTERARIDSNGNLLVGTTSVIDVGRVSISFPVGSANGISLQTSGATYNNNLLSFRNSGGTQVGFVYTNGTTTSYGTSSDYRLKENIQPMTGALAKVAALKPCTYKWKIDGSDGEGFIAHELATVCPQAVTGEKDAVDADGNPVYQGIDTSFLVATLTAAIQELKASLDDVKLEFEAYKATHP